MINFKHYCKFFAEVSDGESWNFLKQFLHHFISSGQLSRLRLVSMKGTCQSKQLLSGCEFFASRHSFVCWFAFNNSSFNRSSSLSVKATLSLVEVGLKVLFLLENGQWLLLKFFSLEKEPANSSLCLVSVISARFCCFAAGKLWDNRVWTIPGHKTDPFSPSIFDTAARTWILSFRAPCSIVKGNTWKQNPLLIYGIKNHFQAAGCTYVLDKSISHFTQANCEVS